MKRVAINLRSDKKELTEMKRFAKRSGMKTVSAFLRHLFLEYKKINPLPS